MAAIDDLLVKAWALHGRGEQDAARKLADQILQLDPTRSAAWHLQGVVAFEAGRHEQAIEWLRYAALLDGRSASIHFAMSLPLAALGRWAEATESLERAVTLEPDFARAHSNLCFMLNYDPERSPESVWAAHRRYGEVFAGLGQSRPATADDPERRLRVGFVSPNFYEHPIYGFFEPLLAHLDPAEFETFLYAETTVDEPAADRLLQLAHHWRDVGRLPDDELADLVRRDRIDILVDLAGHCAGNRFHKPAPVQVSYPGYPNSTGLPTVDYRLTDEVADPSGEPTWHSETLFRLAPAFFCYAPPAAAPEVGPLPASAYGAITFGSLHNPAKLNDHVLYMWSRLLASIPMARLLIFRDLLRGEVASRLSERLRAHGIPPEMVDIRHELPAGQSHLGVYQEIDVALDVFPWSGHTTAIEALWMGVPVVTLRGPRHAGRMVASALSAAGCEDWIADTPEQYLAIATELARDRASLADVRSRLRAQCAASPLCDVAGFSRQFSACFRTFWRRRCAGPGEASRGSS